MRLASAAVGGRDGALLLVSADARRVCPANDIVPTLQQALEQWQQCAPLLEARAGTLRANSCAAMSLTDVELAAPLPRSFQWLDGSAYLSHVERVRRARGAALPPELLTDPLMYQGTGEPLLAATAPIPLGDPDWGLDIEAEVGIITDDVPMGVSAVAARDHIRLLVLINDISLRNLIAAELAKGFGFLHGKPPSALAPFAVTPDELGSAWDGGRVHLPMRVYINGERLGEPDAGDGMQFDFPALISHAAKTRPLGAGTLIGSGTVSNPDRQRGYACLVEKRVVEIVDFGTARTPYLKPGDHVRIRMCDSGGRSVFGDIEQEVVSWPH